MYVLNSILFKHLLSGPYSSIHTQTHILLFLYYFLYLRELAFAGMFASLPWQIASLHVRAFGGTGGRLEIERK